MRIFHKIVILLASIGVFLLCGCSHELLHNTRTIPLHVSQQFNHRQIPHLRVLLNKFPDTQEKIFIDSGGIPGIPDGAEILDKTGRPMWFYAPPAGQVVRGFRVQHYLGKPVLTWWQGTYEYIGGGNWHGVGTDYIADEHYHVIARLDPPGMPPDGHEFRLLSHGTALISSHKKRQADLSSVGGPKDGQIWDGTAAIVDVTDNRVLSQWDVYDHVPISDSYASLQDKNEYRQGVFNPYQLNSISLAPHGNLLVSLRNTSTLYLVDPQSGHILWRLGGKHSHFVLGPGVEFMAQHDAQFLGQDMILMFNDNSNGFHTYGPSSVELLQVHNATRTVTLIRNQTRPDGSQATATGSAQLVSSDGLFVDWGDTGKLCEFNLHGQLVYDAVLHKPGFTYRVYLASWAGNSTMNTVMTIGAGYTSTTVSEFGESTNIE